MRPRPGVSKIDEVIPARQSAVDDANSVLSRQPDLRALAAQARSSAPMAGWAALALAGLATITLPPGLPIVVLATVAFLGLSRDPRLGSLPAALLVVVALPYGRGADSTAYTILGFPLRPADPVIALAVLFSLPAAARHVRRLIRRDTIIPGAFLMVGLLAAGLGVAQGNELRDILRDARWWALFGSGLLAMAVGTTPSRLVRAITWGALALAFVAIATTALPVFDGGLKAQALAYDRGTLRMQFDNTFFLLPAIAILAARWLRSGRTLQLGAIGALFLALALSLTRVTVIAGLGMIVMFAILAILRPRWKAPGRTRGLRALAPGALLATAVVGVAAGTIVSFAAPIGTNGTTNLPANGSLGAIASPPPENPLDRLLFQSGPSDIDTILGSTSGGGRLATYGNAMGIVANHLWLGAGLGSLVEVDFAYDSARAFTIGKQPGVDDAYLTIAMKAGLVGLVVFAVWLVWPLAAAIGRRRYRHRSWLAIAWLAIMGLMLTQSFAVSTYSPFGLGLLAALPTLGYAARSVPAAARQL